ncbi:hypothetical protein PFICI_00963 [Pestalotiopsis fici W106-1]|uniref:FAD dependent oxidoreductase domain-containing protein n=1 Tax=Pestalotiopsis fici (strain W106-1 / CGMCC3.15140) TaxID=1229662 RepID=W3XME6_PESFW|nr:uncharacterized protein PFICI_00963 [Pestalotiopsis fici W106-1]ETS87135.1 hypothetical protein PFICI_00963 [Pestalotiopsis fici W106-1]
MAESRVVNIVGAGIFGLSLAIALRSNGHKVTVFDQCPYDDTGYAPGADPLHEAASVDHNKIMRSSYGKKIHYQRLSLESRELWLQMNQEHGKDFFVESCMLRVQPSDQLGLLERETLDSLTRDGLRDTQFVKGDAHDRLRAAELGWDHKLLDFNIPGESGKTFEAVLDTISGFIKCSESCAHLQKMAVDLGVDFRFGPEKGCFESLVLETQLQDTQETDCKKAIGIKTRDSVFHQSDVVVIAGGSCSTQLLPELSYHLESSAGSIVTFKIDPNDEQLWTKYAPENFPVMTWKSAPRDENGKDTGSVYVFPRTTDGLIKIGYRGIKFTNFVPAPKGTPFTQDGQWSVPLPPGKPEQLPRPAVEAIRRFVSVFLPEFAKVPFHSSKFCWYTDSLDNSFVSDYVPTYADQSVFVCTGGSGHGAKFLPVLGKHAADIFEHGSNSSSFMYPFWCWRDDAPRGNGLEEGPSGPRNIGHE